MSSSNFASCHPSDTDDSRDMSAMDAKDASHATATVVHPTEDETKMKSPGIVRMEALTASMTLVDRIFLYFSIFLVAYAYNLDGIMRIAYQPFATAAFQSHSLLSTVNIVRAVIAAVAQTTAAKIADVFGRVELICVSAFFYAIGTVIQAVSTNVATYIVGNAMFQIGYTMIMLLVEVVIADTSSTRSRLLFIFIPNMPSLINTWISGNIVEASLKAIGWRWGVGMWSIIYPVCALPIIISLMVVARRAKDEGRLTNYRSSFEMLGLKDLIVKAFWLLDVIGILLLIAVFALILVPLTLAGGGHSTWGSAHIIAPIVVGVLCIPLLVFWELKASNPVVPFSLMKDRGIWGPIGLAVCSNFAWTMQGDYLFTVLIVAFNFSVSMATRVTSLYSFVIVVIGPFLGILVYKLRRLKIFAVVGSFLYLISMGLLIRYRGSASADSHAGVIAAQVVMGVAGGLFAFPAQASLQVGLKHEHLAVMTAVYLALYNIGSALGNAVAGGIWTQLLPSALEHRLDNVNSTLARLAYEDPLATVAHYPMGTPERDAIVSAYQYIQRILTITGICACVPQIVFSLFIRNPRLTDKQTLVEEEVRDEIEMT
ncbi:Siderophore iron transporter 1 [Cladobotryum mycophilum]|uniref:Siderophore iron transporter 1 n=1 Tax=Cladobotryum mycophilum TaxID=491253 RepID=A0ABR0SIK9_9HYPO